MMNCEVKVEGKPNTKLGEPRMVSLYSRGAGTSNVHLTKRVDVVLLSSRTDDETRHILAMVGI